MVRKEGLQSKRYDVPATGAEADIGTVIEANMRRYIYRVKVQDNSGAANLVELKKQPPGDPAPAIEVVDQFRLLADETYVDPEELREDALPLYILEAGCQMRAVGTGIASLLLEYEDSE